MILLQLSSIDEDDSLTPQETSVHVRARLDKYPQQLRALLRAIAPRPYEASDK